MELKKHPKVDLERNKSTLQLIGYVLTLAIMLMMFEYTTRPEKVEGFGELKDVELDDEIIPITRADQPPPPPPPPPKQISEVLNIVEDDVKVEQEYEAEDTEIDQETEVQVVEVQEEEQEPEVFFIVEEMPQFPGGDIELQKYIAKNVKYPALARENDIQGKVFIRFVVTEKGTVDKVQVARGVDPLLDEEAMRVVKTLPAWTPGKQRGKAVRVWYTVPINFQLQ